MKKVIFEDITIQVGNAHGYPVETTISAEDQKAFIDGGYGTIEDLIDMEISSYRDWQADC